MDFAGERAALLADRSRAGRGFCEAYTELVDRWLRELYASAVGERAGVALVALGGHGRRELVPGGDVDLMVLHGGRTPPAGVDALWYPIWDAGLKLGHSVRTEREALGLARDDLATATALLSARSVAGDDRAVAALHEEAVTQWRKRGELWLDRLGGSVEARHAGAAEVAFALEPDLKDGRGGLRDVHAMSWAAATGLVGAPADRLSGAYDRLLAVRVALHRVTGRTGDRLPLQEQDAVAAVAGFADADELMAAVAADGRVIAWGSDELWYDVGTRRSRARAREPFPGGSLDASAVLAAAAAAASRHARLDAAGVAHLAKAAPPHTPWTDPERAAFVGLLAEGRPAIAVAETLDHAGYWERLLPEWAGVRSRPQRNAYHQFTVDRHLLEAVAEASQLVERVDRPDLLLLGVLLHDIGKGSPGDHTEVGVAMVATIAARMGLPAADVATLVFLVQQHLLLPDVATRRDLDDPETIASVARAVGSEDRLRLLHALTEADSIATGPSAWGAWKAGLVAELVARVAAVMAGHAVSDVVGGAPGERWSALLDEARHGQPAIAMEDGRLTVVCPDRPGLFSRVAGTLALCGLDVQEAMATSQDGFAIEEFRVVSRLGIDVDRARVQRDLRRALTGRLAIAVRLAERARSYREGPRAPLAFPPDVRIFDDASADATVIEVVGPDSVGLLYRLTQALAELDLDIARAKVVTLGHDAVDTFYVRDARGEKIADPDQLAEIRTALRFALGAADGGG